MKARAPGKVVISGAYSVLWGAPAIVTAVDRYVEADSDSASNFVSEEMRLAMPGPYPGFDASALRSGGQKLGVGSSAAILLATLASAGQEDPEHPDARTRLFERALFAHRRAQGGGSGVDVAASTFGGTLVVQLPEPLAPTATSHALGYLPRVTPGFLPKLTIEVWASPTAASTADFIRQVSAFALQSPTQFAPLLNGLTTAAVSAVAALQASDPAALLQALDAQGRELERLGAAVGLPIVTDAVSALAQRARAQGATVLPAGAGGGDVSLYVGLGSPCAELRAACQDAGQRVLDLTLEARGVHQVAVRN